jgi:hypothetical protein
MIPDDLRKLVSTSFGEQAAQELRDHSLTNSEKETLKTAAHDVMRCFKPVPGACVMMSALLHLRLKQLSNAPTYFVAGTLQVNGTYAYGTTDTIVDEETFAKSNPDWDGHAWVQHGQYILDVAVRRTVAAGKAPRVLADHIRKNLGESTGALCADNTAMQQDSLIYKPLRVLTQVELNPLINGAVYTFAGEK